MCKELPGVVPLLGRHPFLCLSIDDLFVLKRFLATLGELAHFLEVRQVLAGMKGVRLFDEIDHLGAYITKNRFDRDIEEQRAKDKDKPSLIVWDGMSKPVDDYFSQPDWEHQPIPKQECPAELERLLGALDRTRMPGWLAAESHIRNYGAKGRLDLASGLETLRGSLAQHPNRYFSVTGEEALFIWLQTPEKPIDLAAARDKAAAAMLATRATRMIGVAVVASHSDGYLSAQALDVALPKERTAENAHIYDDAERMRIRVGRMDASGDKKVPGGAPPWTKRTLLVRERHQIQKVSRPTTVSRPTLPGGVVHKLPQDLKTALVSAPNALAAWENITPLARNEWICWVTSCKKPETRARHIDRACEDLAKGKRRPCCWPGCPHR